MKLGNLNLSSMLKASKNDDSLIFNDKHRAIKNYKLMQVAKIATLGLYIVAIFMLYVADVWGLASFVEKNSSEFIALIVFSAISLVLAYFLASSKEATYEDIAIHISEGWKVKGTHYAVMLLYLSTGLGLEMLSTTNNQQHIANSVAESSSMMKSVQGSNVSVVGADTSSYEKASVKLATCNKLLEKGKVKDCNESIARVNAAKESIAMHNEMSVSAATKADDSKVDAMLKVRESFDKPMFKEVGALAGGGNNRGMLIVIGVLILMFELQHILALFAYANSLKRVISKQGKPEYQEPIQSPTPLSKADYSMPLSVSSFVSDKAKNFISDELTMADNARRQSMATMQKGIDKAVDSFNSSIPYPANKRMSVSETIQALVKASNGAKDEEEIKRNVFSAYAGMFNPAPLDDDDLLKVCSKVNESLSPALTASQARVLGTEEKQLDLGLSSESSQLGNRDTSQLGNRARKSSESSQSVSSSESSNLASSQLGKDSNLASSKHVDGMYRAWLAMVKLGKIKHSKAATEGFIRQHHKQASSLSGVQVTALWNEWLDKAVSDGALVSNPKYQEGDNHRIPKYVLKG